MIGLGIGQNYRWIYNGIYEKCDRMMDATNSPWGLSVQVDALYTSSFGNLH